MKKVFSLFTSLVMVISLVGVMPTMSVGALESGDYEYKILGDGTVEITDYNNGSATELTIPSTIAGRRVTSIGGNAFALCNSLTSVTIPDSVTSIGEDAFSSCDSLTSVTIPDSVTRIGEYAFSYCDSLTSVTIPDSVTSIGSYAFKDCYSLTSIKIPDGVTSIGNCTFLGCSQLKSITIPDSVTSIGDWAFSDCESLTSATIPDSVTSIGDCAFAYCDSLTSITIPDSVTSIGYCAFYDCDNLTIKCYTNSTAHQYAKNNGIKYKLLSSISVSKPTTFKMALNSSSSVRLSWNKVSGANGYILEQYKSGKWTRVAKITNKNTTVYSVKKLASGTTYKFRMKAYKMSGGKAYYSGYTSTLTTCTKPATPKAKMVLNSSVSVRLSWNKVTGAGGYIIEQYKNGSWVRVAKVAGTSTVQYSVKGLASGTTYKFRVKAYKMLGSKAYYSSYSSTVTTCTKPATVKFTLTAGTNKATVKWNKVTGASGYIVYYRTSPSKGWTRLTKVGASTTSYTKTGLTGGKTYYFTVKAYKFLGSTPYYGGVTSKSVKPGMTIDEMAKSISNYYTKIAKSAGDEGQYVTYSSEVYEWNGNYTFLLRYQVGEKKAQEIIANGGYPSANRYVGDVYVNKTTGKVTDDFGNKAWYLW